MKNILFVLSLAILITSCKSGKNEMDASGVFETDEIIVSSEVNGKILQMNAEEGKQILKNEIAVIIDTTTLLLQKEQVEASISALGEKTNNPAPYIEVLEQQYAVQQSRLASLERDKKRFENLVTAQAATQKQLDDITTQVEVMKREMNVTKQQIVQQRSSLSTQNRSILSDGGPLKKRVEQIDDQLKRSQVLNPVSGTVLTKYAEAGEITAAGKALYKIADLTSLNLKAYISGAQLSQLKLNQQIKVFTDDGADKYKEYTGTITWISDKAEFTPKTIQTKEERANLVYAVKIKVKNDGYLKIGMYGEVKFSAQ